MQNLILCYHTGSGNIQRIVNGDVIKYDICGLSEAEAKVQISSSENNRYFFSRRFSGSAEQLASGSVDSSSLVLQDYSQWSINGLQLSSSMDVSIPAGSPFNLELKVLDGETNQKTTLSGNGIKDRFTVEPRWHIESLIAPDDEDEVASYDFTNADLDYQPFTNGEATESIDLTSDNNRLYLLRTGDLNVNLIKD